MLERLTFKIGNTYGLENKASAKVGLFTNYDGFYAYLVATNKLGEYEDTGLEPNEIVRLKEDAGYLEWESQGYYDALTDDWNAIEKLEQENAKLAALDKVQQEVIIELQKKLAEAMELLELAKKDIDFLSDHFGCAGCDGLKSDWSDKKADWHDCPFAGDEKYECLEEWQYADRYEKLKGGVQNERD